LEVGCGSGSFAHLLFDKTHLGYVGFDFSEKAVEKARLRTNRPDVFLLGDATHPESYQKGYDAVVCLEVLEHIEMDHQVIDNWRPGCPCVCSVPNFDDATHVRYFMSEDEIRNRYGGLIDIRRIKRVPRPLLRGRSIREYLRQLRWSRGEPKRFLAHLGYRTFENLAGWFVFSGYRHPTTHMD
jgi:2-polyprenyl-3-methyl-5-hydroxy-6-metoxy-1,4-benzoquinol methylase